MGEGDTSRPCEFLDEGDGYLSTHATTPFDLDGKTWSSVEQYFHDQLYRPGLTEEDKHEAMYRALCAKYQQHPALGSRLLDTGDRPLRAKDRPDPIARPPAMPPVLIGHVLEDVRRQLRTTKSIHPYLECRLGGLFDILNAAYVSSQPFTTDSKGGERELFVNHFLRVALPPAYRFSSGEIVDSYRRRSGQVDIVIEPPLLYSFPVVEGGPRLHLAEGVAVAVEVKSTLATQWAQIERTATAVKKLERRFQGQFDEWLLALDEARAEVVGGTDAAKSELERQRTALQAMRTDHANSRVSVLAVGFEGWGDSERLAKYLKGTPDVDAVFVIRDRLFVRKKPAKGDPTMLRTGIWSLMACLDFLMEEVRKTFLIYPTTMNYDLGPSGGAR